MQMGELQIRVTSPGTSECGGEVSFFGEKIMSTISHTAGLDKDNFAAFVDEIGDSGPVSVAGARTRWDLGGALSSTARVVTAPAGVVEYLPDEMTVTVLAGTPVHELSQVLAEHGQRCALPERGGTVGGAVVVGENHLEVLDQQSVASCSVD